MIARGAERIAWRQFHFDGSRGGVNPYETILNRSNVSQLGLLWDSAVSATRTVLVARGLALVAGDTQVTAMDARTGAIVWSHRLGGSVGDPVVHGNVAYVPTWNHDAGPIFALDLVTGDMLWSAGGFGGLDLIYADGKLISNGIYGEVWVLDAATGVLLWQSDTSTIAIAVEHGVLYGSLSCYSMCGSTYAADLATGSLLWQGELPDDGIEMAVAGDKVFISGFNGLFAVDAATGRLSWTFDASTVDTPAIAGGIVYIGADDHNIYALNAHTGELIWSFEASLKVRSSPTVANGVVYVGSDDRTLRALDSSTGALLWQWPVPATPSSPSVVNGHVFLAGYSGFVMAFALSGRERSALGTDSLDVPEYQYSAETLIGPGGADMATQDG